MTRTVAYNIIQLLFVIGFAPLYAGVLSRFKENVQSKRGPSIFQPYRDLWKLFQKMKSYLSRNNLDFPSHAVSSLCNSSVRHHLDSGSDGLSAGFCLHGGHAGGWFFSGPRRLLRCTRGGRYRKPLRSYGSQPYTHGGLSSGTGFYDCVLHRIVCSAIDHPLHRPAEMGS